MDKFILKYFTLIRTLIAILIGVALAVGLIFIVSKDPVFSLRSFLLAPFLSRSPALQYPGGSFAHHLLRARHCRCVPGKAV